MKKQENFKKSWQTYCSSGIRVGYESDYAALCLIFCATTYTTGGKKIPRN